MFGWRGWSYFSRFSTVRVLVIGLEGMTKTDTLTFEAEHNNFRGGFRYLNISSEGEDELYPFLYDQFHCGNNERMHAYWRLMQRLNVVIDVNSFTIVEQPYMARLRYVSRDIIRRLEITKLIFHFVETTQSFS